MGFVILFLVILENKTYKVVVAFLFFFFSSSKFHVLFSFVILLVLIIISVLFPFVWVFHPFCATDNCELELEI